MGTASADKTVKVWDALTGNELLTLQHHAAKVTGVAFSPDGTKLATCGADKRIIIYDGTPKQANESGAAKPSEKTFTFPVDERPWTQVIEWFTDQTDLAYVGGGAVLGGKFKYTGLQNKQYTLTEVVDILNEALQSQRQPYLLIRGSRSFRLIPGDEKVDPKLVQRVAIDELDKFGKTELVSVTVKLKYIQVVDLEPTIKRMIGSFSEVKADKATNSLIIQDTAGNLKRILEAVRSAEKAELDKRG